MREGFCLPSEPRKKFEASHGEGPLKLIVGMHFSLKQQGRMPNLSQPASLILAEIAHRIFQKSELKTAAEEGGGLKSDVRRKGKST